MNTVEELKEELAKLKAAKEAVINGEEIDPNTLEAISMKNTDEVEPVVEKPAAKGTSVSDTMNGLADKYDDIVEGSRASFMKQIGLLETANTSDDIAGIKEAGLQERTSAREALIEVQGYMDTLRVASEVRDKVEANVRKSEVQDKDNTDDKSYLFTVAPTEIMSVGARRLLVPVNKIIEMAKKTNDTVLKKITGNNGEVDYEPTSMPEDMMSRFSYKLTGAGKNLLENFEGFNIIPNSSYTKGLQEGKSYVLSS